MKTKIILFVFLAAVVTFSSCKDFLEEPPDVTGLTEATVFTRMSDAERVLAGAYAFSPWGFPQYQGAAAWSYGILNYFASLAAHCDEAEVATLGENFLHLRYHEGTLAANEIYPFREDKWDMYWIAVREAWLFYDNVDRVEDGTPRTVIDKRKGEALGMIATKYYEMFIRYGGLPWIDKYYQVGEMPPWGMTRMNVQATGDSILRLCDRAMEFLPMRNDPGEFGRVNKLAMMVLKARTKLWLASPLFNANDSWYPVYGDQQLIKLDNYDRQRWKDAADAAKAAIDAAKAAGYALYTKGATPKENYKKGVTGFPELTQAGGNVSAGGNPEIIWGTRIYPNNDGGEGNRRNRFYSKANFPGFGPQYVIPLQNMVNKYETKDGDKQSANFYNQADPYSKLDARFDVTVVYQGRQLGSYKIDMSPGGDNDASGAGMSTTGYFLCKFFNERWMTGEDSNSENFWPYMRLAELYLIYAEALCEYDYSANKDEILYYLNEIRTRAGQPKLQDAKHFKGHENDQEYMRECIQNERAVEMAFEELRYFDLKRWKLGPEYIGGRMYRMDIGGTTDNPTYNPTSVFEERVFSDKWYLYSIMESDTQKSNGQLVQNPGW